MNAMEAAQSLVDRTRQGDQVAMAGIVIAREQAKRGNPKAQVALNLIKGYIDANPYGGSSLAASSMHGERVKNALAKLKTFIATKLNPKRYVTAVFGAVPQIGDSSLSSITLANGPALVSDAADGSPINVIREGFGTNEEQQAFEHGMQFCMAPAKLDGYTVAPVNIRRAVEIGKSVGIARLIQLVRMPGVQISVFSRAAGWEHGE